MPCDILTPVRHVIATGCLVEDSARSCNARSGRTPNQKAAAAIAKTAPDATAVVQPNDLAIIGTMTAPMPPTTLPAETSLGDGVGTSLIRGGDEVNMTAATRRMALPCSRDRHKLRHRIHAWLARRSLVNEPFEYVIDRASGIVTVVYSAPVNARRWEATMDRVLADPSAERPYRFIGDRRAVAGAPSLNYVDGLVDYVRQHREQLRGTRWAHLVDPANPGAFGMALVIEAQSEPLGLDVEVFTDYQKAIGWLTASSS